MKKTGVLGAGTMGAGIIQVMAQSGYEVTFIEQKQEFVDRGLEKISGVLEKAVRKGRMSEEDKTAALGHFYPRPPRGGRPLEDVWQKRGVQFLSTPSARRATDVPAVCPSIFTISIHALREEGDSHRFLQ